LIRKLHGTDELVSKQISPKLALTKIQMLTGAPWKYIKMAITNPQAIDPGKCFCRHCPDKELTQEEVDFLCND
jgi:hypothetical protein